MKRILSIIFGILAASEIIVCPESNAEAPVRVGVIAPLTGPSASLGTYVRNGIELGLEQLSVEDRALVTVAFDDDQGEALKSVSSYQRLSEESPLDVVLTVGSGSANAIVTRTEARKEVLVGIGASDPGIVQSRRFAFVHWVPPAALGEVLSKELRARNFARIAFVSAQHVGAQADVNGAIAALQKDGTRERIVYNESFTQEELEYRPAIQKIKSLKADAVVLVLFPTNLPIFLAQARQLHLDSEIVGMETFEDSSVVAASHGLLEGKWYVNAAEPIGNFQQLYKTKYGEHPGWGAANGFDTIQLVAYGARARGTSAAGVREYLASLKDYSGACGKYSATGDNRFALPAALKRVMSNAFVTVPTSK